jgi:asparagine synthase (glutamine-hydrolysing)
MLSIRRQLGGQLCPQLRLQLSRSCGNVAFFRFNESMRRDPAPAGAGAGVGSSPGGLTGNASSPTGIRLETALQAGMRSINHRGPDSNGHFISEDVRVGMGHVRLSLVDLSSAGSQPMLSEAGNVALVANGELYGHEAIREELQAKGYVFKSKSDSEVILGLYHDQGFRCFERMRGEFAFCLHDNRSNLFMAARDRFGIKPLFYAVHDNTLFVASEIKALFAMGVPAVWNPEALMKGGHGLTRHSIFRGVHQVPPAHYITATPNGNINVVPYWDASYPDKDFVEPRSEEEMILQVREKLFESVELRMHADVPASVYLSGGLDSCAVLGLAAAATTRKLDAFTIRFVKLNDPLFSLAVVFFWIPLVSLHPFCLTHRTFLFL